MIEMPNPDSTLEQPEPDYETDGTECLDCGELAIRGYFFCGVCLDEAEAEFVAEMRRDDL